MGGFKKFIESFRQLHQVGGVFSKEVEEHSVLRNHE